MVGGGHQPYRCGVEVETQVVRIRWIRQVGGGGGDPGVNDAFAQQSQGAGQMDPVGRTGDPAFGRWQAEQSARDGPDFQA
jgi:hypothetical protein